MSFIQENIICGRCKKEFNACHEQTAYGTISDVYCNDCDVIIEQEAFKAWSEANFPNKTIKDIIKYIWKQETRR